MTQVASRDFFVPFNEISLVWRSDGECPPSRVSELSRTGAFVWTSSLVPVGTVLGLRLAIPGREICLQAVVRSVSPGRGIGIEFESMADDDRARLYTLVQQMELMQ